MTIIIEKIEAKDKINPTGLKHFSMVLQIILIYRLLIWKIRKLRISQVLLYLLKYFFLMGFGNEIFQNSQKFF